MRTQRLLKPSWNHRSQLSPSVLLGAVLAMSTQQNLSVSTRDVHTREPVLPLLDPAGDLAGHNSAPC